MRGKWRRYAALGLKIIESVGCTPGYHCFAAPRHAATLLVETL
jgi:hypothetical protein